MLPSDPLNLGTAVWQLHGTTAKDAVCMLREFPLLHVWALQVIRADEALLTVHFPDKEAALGRANQIKKALIAKGWTQVPVGDVAPLP